jgi:hypothetical protein
MSFMFRFYCPLFFLLISFSTSICAQGEVDRLLGSIRNGNNIVIQDYDITESDINLLIRQFESQLPLFNSQQRYISYFFLQRIALGFDNIAPQSQLLDLIVKVGLKDPDAGNRSAAIELLYAFPLNSYTNAIKNSIASYVVSKEKPFTDFVRLAGWAKIAQVEVPLLELLRLGKLSNKERWEVHLVLGRIGNEESLQFCMQMIRNAGMNDLVVFSLVPEIIYLNQKEGIDYLLMKILDDDKFCSSPNPEIEVNINCAYRLIESVAPVIVDFPVQVGASGDLLVADYDVALNDVRIWIHEHYQTYQIKE